MFLLGFVSFCDVIFSLFDVLTDYWQGVELLLKDEVSWEFGAITLIINWVPGLAAAIHLVANFRTKLPAKKTVSYAGTKLAIHLIIVLN